MSARPMMIPAVPWKCSCGGENLTIDPKAVHALTPKGFGKFVARCMACQSWRRIERVEESRIITDESRVRSAMSGPMTKPQARRFRGRP